MARVTGLLLITVILAGSALLLLPATALSKCAYVHEYFSYCLDFLVGHRAMVTKRCCNHVEKLNYIAKHILGPRLICECIESIVRGMEPPMIAYNIYALPFNCRTHLSFPISTGMDCSLVPSGPELIAYSVYSGE